MVSARSVSSSCLSQGVFRMFIFANNQSREGVTTSVLSSLPREGRAWRGQKVGAAESLSAHTLKSVPWGNSTKVCPPSQTQGLTKSLLELQGEVIPCRRSQESEINGELFEGNVSIPCYLSFWICRWACVCHKLRRKASYVAIPLRLLQVSFIKMIKCFGSYQPPGLTAGWASRGIKGWRRWARDPSRVSQWHLWCHRW